MEHENEGLGPQREAFKKIVRQLPMSKRKALGSEIKVMQQFLGFNDDLISDRRGSHWANERFTELVRVNIRGQGFVDQEIQDACKFVGKSVKQLRLLFSARGGKVHFQIDDQVVTVIRLKKKKEFPAVEPRAV